MPCSLFCPVIVYFCRTNTISLTLQNKNVLCRTSSEHTAQQLTVTQANRLSKLTSLDQTIDTQNDKSEAKQFMSHNIHFDLSEVYFITQTDPV